MSRSRRIRALVRDDIPALVPLHRKMFGGRQDENEHRAYLAEIFCDHPWSEPDMPSWVCENDDGELVGCIGVMPRPMELHGRPLRAAVFHDFMVDPEHRSAMAAFGLLEKALEGPQELSLADGNAASRQIWEAVGGDVVTSYSLRWIRPLQPLRSAAHLLAGAGRPAAIVKRTLSPALRLADAMLTRFPGSPLRPVGNGTRSRALHADELLEAMGGTATNAALRPSYDAESVQWLLTALTREGTHQELRRAFVADDDGRIQGWYLYYAKNSGIGEVLQVGARPGRMNAVVGHLIYDAWRAGLVTLSGQVEPRLVEALSAHRALFDNAGFWMLAHSRNPDVLNALHRGDAFLSRLEVEGWMRLAC